MSEEKLKENPTSAELIEALEKNKHSHENVLKLLGQLSILIIARDESFENLSYTAFCFAEVLNPTNSWDAHIGELFNLLSEKSDSYKDCLQLVRFSTVGSNYDESFAEKMLKNALDHGQSSPISRIPFCIGLEKLTGIIPQLMYPRNSPIPLALMVPWLRPI